MWVEFLRDYKCCWKEGDVGEVSLQFGTVVVEAGYAKAVDSPRKHKMVLRPQGAK